MKHEIDTNLQTNEVVGNQHEYLVTFRVIWWLVLPESPLRGT